jgi:hypothetical protein
MCALGWDRVPGSGEERIQGVRRPELWLRRRREALGGALGGQVVLVLLDGSAYVGQLVCDEPRFVIRVAGTGALSATSPARMREIYAVPPHTHAERREILARQRAGGPAALLERKKRRNA